MRTGIGAAGRGRHRQEIAVGAGQRPQARAEGVRPQSMAKTVRVLEEAGLVSGSADPRDGRRTLLRLTEAAAEQFRTGRRAKEDWLTQTSDWKARGAFLLREELPDGMTLALVAVAQVNAGDRTLYVTG